MTRKVSVVIQKDRHGWYAYCPELEACQSQGDSLEEVMKEHPRSDRTLPRGTAHHRSLNRR